MPEITKSIHSRSGESTRPDLSPEQEAEICRLDADLILSLRHKLDQAPPGPQSERAWDEYVKATSVSITEAAIMIGRPPVQLKELASRGSIKAFQHRNRWRIWLAHLEACRPAP